MKKSQLRQIIKEEISKVLSESNWFEDVANRKGNIVHTKSGTYKILTTKPNINKPDFYLDTDMDRIQQIDPNDEGNYDLDISSYKKAVKINEMKKSL